MSDTIQEIFLKIKEKHLRLLLICVGCIFVLLTGLFFCILTAGRNTEQKQVLLASSPSNAAVVEKSQTKKTAKERNPLSRAEDKLTFFVDVKGAVLHSQVVKVTNGEIVQTAINRAGGALANADLNQLNLAAGINAGQVIYVPRQGETIPDQFAASQATSHLEQGTADSSGRAGEEGKINLNQADAARLQTINGIGEKKAQEIIKYRDENGNFKTVDDLTKISGFGEKTVAKLKDYVTVE